MFKECAAVGIEEPRGMNPGPTFRVQGAVLQKIPRETIVYPLIPSQWRKAVGLKGNAQKPDIMAHVLTLFPEFTDVWPQDACDAWCVAEATRLAVSGVRC
jgi:Holliday junction resolvasome RuvABC endonuclease subunit